MFNSASLSRLVLATHNRDKVVEIRSSLAGLPVQIRITRKFNSVEALKV